MSAAGDRQGTNADGVLSKLPRTRPQRASARRAAAREGEAARAPSPPAGARKGAAGKAKTTRASRAQGAAGSSRASAATSSRAGAAGSARTGGRGRAGASTSAAKDGRGAEERVPRQGFECEGERPGSSVHPPGGAELVASAAEIVSELAKAGAARGERMLREALSRLPLP
ncbi:MAG TPA: hypothetical protein VL979_09830 [Solirubrobacteraceae bacterium]|nr:hypothetical protein [Solirubrobacteraceae bacterium]